MATSKKVPLNVASGPRKKRRAGPPALRLSGHKARSAWFRARAAWPLREPPRQRLTLERRRAAQTLQAAKLAGEWTLAGPSNIGGRCTALVCDPGNADQIWIGAAGGGVWASADAGQSWTPCWPQDTPLEIGSLAIDPTSPKTLYCGTGEANLSADSYAGDGIYKSTDAGKIWTPWGPSAKTGVPKRIGAIAVDPFDSRHIVCGGIGFGRLSADGDFGGLYVTHDGGATWRREVFVSPANYWCHSIVFDPSRQGTLYATFTAPGARNGIYRSRDGGSTWTQLLKGLPSPDRVGRTSLAISSSHPSTLYAQCSDVASGRADRLLGVFRSNDGGDSWADIAGNHFKNEGQMSYGNSIAVHPQNPDHVICGGVDLHVTTNGGAQWRYASHWDANRGDNGYAHADHHAVVMPIAAPGRVYTANDGGMDMSEDGGKTWVNRSNGLAITMFYDVDVAQSDARLYGGGAQDNGTLITSDGQANTFRELLGGDGGWMIVDPREAGHIFATFQYGGMYRFRKGSSRKVTPPFKQEDMAGVWMVYTTFDPKRSDVVYTGNTRLYRTQNDGVSWEALTPQLDGSPISAIEVAEANTKFIYVGSENGGFFRSSDGGATWSANLADGTLPSVMITRIVTHPADAKAVYITTANFGNSHVFHSADAGATWKDIDGGKLPDVPHHALVIRPDAPKELWACSDVGGFMTPDGGTNWANATANLAHVMVVDLIYHASTKMLLAATYGRSVWKAKLA